MGNAGRKQKLLRSSATVAFIGTIVPADVQSIRNKACSSALNE